MVEKRDPFPLAGVIAFSAARHDMASYNTNEEDLKKFLKSFFKEIRKFPPDAQEYIADLSSEFLERDIHKEYQTDPQKLQDIANDLKSVGLNKKNIQMVMKFFNFPYGDRN